MKRRANVEVDGVDGDRSRGQPPRCAQHYKAARRACDTAAGDLPIGLGAWRLGPRGPDLLTWGLGAWVVGRGAAPVVRLVQLMMYCEAMARAVARVVCARSDTESPTPDLSTARDQPCGARQATRSAGLLTSAELRSRSRCFACPHKSALASSTLSACSRCPPPCPPPYSKSAESPRPLSQANRARFAA